MADYLYSDLKLVARQITEQSVEVNPDGTRRTDELPGFIEIGVELDGVFVPLARRKAPGLLADIDRAQKARSQSQGDQPQVVAPAQPVEPAAQTPPPGQPQPAAAPPEQTPPPEQPQPTQPAA